jgi:hypothetical protein
MLRPEGAHHDSPGQSAAPPWVGDSNALGALKGRHSGWWSMSKIRDNLEELCSRIFSTMAFGSLFGTWLIITIVLTYKRGWLAAIHSLVAYLCIWLLVSFTGYVISRGDRR